MNNSKIDRLILDSGWKGTLTRVVGIVLVYLGIKYLPDAVMWASTHSRLTPMSAHQIECHGAILFVFTIVFGFALAFEVIRSAYTFLSRRRTTKRNSF
jgi:hypothetical protein